MRAIIPSFEFLGVAIASQHFPCRVLAGYISEELRKQGIETILVGGACVSIYSKNRYQSYDLDYITYEDMKKVKAALAKLGFAEKNKYFQHRSCQWLIEFVSPPVAVGNEPVSDFNMVNTPFGEIRLLYPIDSVKDRLSNFYHWDDQQALEQAIAIYREQEIDLPILEAWSRLEGKLDAFGVFKRRLQDLSR